MSQEIWKPVVGHDGYEVSDLGRVRSLDRQMIYTRRAGDVEIEVRRWRRGRILRPGKVKDGHVTVALGRGKSRLVHHLVLEAFVGPRPPKPFEGLHADDVPDHNALANLSWGSRSRNLHDAVRNGKKAVGQACSFSKLTDIQAAAVKGLKGVVSPTELALHLPVNESTIRQVWSRRSWKSVAALPVEAAREVIYVATGVL